MGSSADLPRRTWVEQIMGMPVSVLARGQAATEPRAEAAVRCVFADLHAVDRLFSPYRADSAVSRVNRGELTLDQCDARMRDVVRGCEWAHERTAGLFDARRPDGVWDPSGWVKGWSAQEAFHHLAEIVDLDWCLNVGGDVVVATPSGATFAVGIADPFDRARVAARVEVASGAVATSGTAEREGHIWDPRTGQGVQARWASVSVRGPDLAVADVLATAAFVVGETWRDILATVPGYSGLAIALDRTVVVSPDWMGAAQ